MIASRLADTLADCRDLSLDRDLILAGALGHDISKPLELSPDGVTEFGQLVPHPYAAVHILASAGLSAEVQHIALSHSPQTAVTPQNIEAHVVALADEAAIHALSVDAIGSIQTDLF
ncbi:HD domain-containing protein [Halobacterium hubeiense]